MEATALQSYIWSAWKMVSGFLSLFRSMAMRMFSEIYGSVSLRQAIANRQESSIALHELMNERFNMPDNLEAVI
ncbi:MAG: hypothetical protein WCE98_06175 [Chlorobium sp.]